MTDIRNILTDKGLAYFVPNYRQHNDFLRLPESHNLHVCPSACGRHHSLQALELGRKDSVSFLQITEADIASGYYEKFIGDAVEELITVLKPLPQAFIIFLKCIDDFLGTDEQALLQELRTRFPSLRFTVCHNHPVALDGKTMPGMSIYNQLYGLLDYSGKKDDGINLIGNFAPIDAESEFFSVLNQWGVHQVRQMFACRTFAEYQQMADSRLNLVLAPIGKLAAENMSRRLGIPYFVSPASYDISEVVQNYENIAVLLDQKSPDFDSEIMQTRRAVQEAREHMGDMPVVVDSSATLRPFALARALHQYGFRVKAIFTTRIRDINREDEAWLTQQYPHIKVLRTERYDAIPGFGFSPECLAIGFDCAYTLRARHFVRISDDESFYGFHGIRKLMGLMRAACDKQTSW